VSLFHKTHQSGFHTAAGRFLEEVEEFLSYNGGIRKIQQFADTLVDCAQCAVQRYGASGIFEGVNELFEAALRARNHLAQLIELLFGGAAPTCSCRSWSNILSWTTSRRRP